MEDLSNQGLVSLKLAVDLSKVKRGAVVNIYYNKIIGIAKMNDMGCVVVADGGATIPVEESEETIKELINKAKASVTKGV